MSPIFSRQRKAWLLSVAECATAFTVSTRTIERRLRERGELVYAEVVTERREGGGGGKRVKYIDPSSLGWALTAELAARVGRSPLSPTPQTDTPTCDRHSPSSSSQREKLPSAVNSVSKLRPTDLVSVAAPLPPTAQALDLLPATPEPTAPITLGDLDAANSLHAELLPILRERKGTAGRSAATQRLAGEKGVTARTVRRWAEAFERGGLGELSRVMGTAPRADKGGHRLPPELVQVVRAALVSNPPTAPVRLIHRTVLRAVPDLAHVPRRNGRVIPISAATVQAIKQEMLDHPTLRLLFADADRRKEYLRTYTGQVLAAHANDLWQMDMTRCDVMVYDPEAGTIYRPRVQVVIDVYSGCIMGIAFSRREDQEQADLVLARALVRKQGPLAERWPMFGVARRLYIDNGKTYKSEHFHRIVGGLGMEIIHSRPRVSHTRGKVERFFGTLHGLERGLIGYCGENAKDRSNEELRRLYRNTLKWAEGGRLVGARDRLMTLSEYQETVLKWLIVDYHETVVHGLTRTQHFTGTAPASTLIDFDPHELQLLFARWEERVVRPDGTVMLGKTLWTTPNGRLAQYRGQTVLTLREPFALGEASRSVAWRDRQGRFQVIGSLVPAPTVADSVEAAAQRRANRLAAAEQLAQVDALRKDLFDPAVTVAGSLAAALPEQVVRPVLPAARARLDAVNPAPLPVPSAEARAFMAPMNGDDVPDDLDELSEWLRR
ncbi:hypothetical protein DAERI_060140 [Deinococcus aerius]|uniref:Integrase catalytic domain-containing protein n=1 Tax=Deinococcus aerius TaxID=200253 RepID=A0A2I9D646_9DEIO|nr:DDE-type integrase/transposase/recombinase [Deinococcus aerius]GBF05880.1 hypothetical protein DAERI_060140 [Deinococcus aerius]